MGKKYSFSTLFLRTLFLFSFFLFCLFTCKIKTLASNCGDLKSIGWPYVGYCYNVDCDFRNCWFDSSNREFCPANMSECKKDKDGDSFCYEKLNVSYPKSSCGNYYWGEQNFCGTCGSSLTPTPPKSRFNYSIVCNTCAGKEIIQGLGSCTHVTCTLEKFKTYSCSLFRTKDGRTCSTCDWISDTLTATTGCGSYNSWGVQNFCGTCRPPKKKISPFPTNFLERSLRPASTTSFFCEILSFIRKIFT